MKFPSRFQRATLVAAGLLSALSASAATLAFEASTSRLAAGRGDVAQLRVRGTADALRDVRISCTQPGLHNLRRPSSTELKIDFAAPRTGDATWILCAAASASTRAYALQVLELLRRDTLAITGLPPLSRVEARIGNQTFGPVRANGLGYAEVPVLLSPAVRVAEILATPPGKAPTTRQQTLSVNPGEQVLLVASQPQVVADGKSATPLFAFVLGARGEPVDNVPSWNTSDGTLSFERIGTGAWAGSFTPYARAVPGEATVTGRTDGGKPGLLRLDLTAGVEPRLTLSSSVPGLPADGLATAELMILITDETGRGLVGQPVTLSASAGSVSDAQERGNGLYVATFTAPTGTMTRVELTASVPGAAASTLTLPLTSPPRLTLEATPKEIRADGSARVQIAITARGPDGRPLADGTAIQLASSLGTVPSTVVVAGGRAVAELVAGTRAGLASVEVRARDATASTQVRLMPGGPARIEVRPERPAVLCDGKDSVELRLFVQDTHGNGVERSALELSEMTPSPENGGASAEGVRGRFESVSALGDGVFSVRYHGPADCDRRSVTVVASAGGAIGNATLAVTRGFSGPIGVTARVGAAHNLGRLTAGEVELEADLPVTVVAPKLRAFVGMSATWTPPFGGVAASLSQTASTYRATAFVGSVRVGPRWTLFEDDRSLVYADAGIDAHIVRLHLVASGGGRTLPALQHAFVGGLHVSLGGGYAVGRGLLLTQLRLAASPLMQGDAAARALVPGASLTLGYRVAF